MSLSLQPIAPNPVGGVCDGRCVEEIFVQPCAFAWNELPAPNLSAEEIDQLVDALSEGQMAKTGQH